MKTNFTKIPALFTVAILAAVGGCNSESSNVGRSIETDVAYLETPRIQIKAQCLAKYFSKEAAVYITPQQHFFTPDSQSLIVESNEPKANYTYQLQGNSLAVSWTGKETNDAQLKEILDPDIATLLYNSVIYSSGLGEIEPCSLRDEKPLKIKGKYYSVTEKQLHSSGKAWAKLKLFVRKDNSLLDRIELENLSTGRIISSLCYDFTFIGQFTNAMPTKVNIFDASAENYDKKQIRQFKYTSFGTSN